MYINRLLENMKVLQDRDWQLCTFNMKQTLLTKKQRPTRTLPFSIKPGDVSVAASESSTVRREAYVATQQIQSGVTEVDASGAGNSLRGAACRWWPPPSLCPAQLSQGDVEAWESREPGFCASPEADKLSWCCFPPLSPLSHRFHFPFTRSEVWSRHLTARSTNDIQRQPEFSPLRQSCGSRAEHDKSFSNVKHQTWEWGGGGNVISETLITIWLLVPDELVGVFSETADLQGVSHKTGSSFCSEWREQ